MSSEERSKKVRERRFVKEINAVGKRLKWAREKLQLLQKEVAYDAGVPTSTYHGREEGARTGYHEEILLIAQSLDRLWQAKYRASGLYPDHNGRIVSKVDVLWVLFGGDPDGEEREAIVEDLKAQIREQERQHTQREVELRAQLSLFSDAVLK